MNVNNNQRVGRGDEGKEPIIGKIHSMYSMVRTGIFQHNRSDYYDLPQAEQRSNAAQKEGTARESQAKKAAPEL